MTDLIMRMRMKLELGIELLWMKLWILMMTTVVG